MKPIPSIVSVDFLIENYDAIAFDSYGVLVDGIDPLPGSYRVHGSIDAVQISLGFWLRTMLRG